MTTPYDQLEQLKAAVEALAPVVARYHSALVEAGLSRDEALQVVVAWQTALLANAVGKDASKSKIP